MRSGKPTATPPSSALFACLVLFSSSPLAIGADAPRLAPAAGASSTTWDGAIELSPFVVTAGQDVGYLAANTLAGSRLNTPLKDTAAAISVLTEELLKDLGATNLTEALEYGNNTQFEREDSGSFGDSPGGNNTFSSFDGFRVRGQKATVARNYFPWTMPVDTYNVERIEEARGPNSILFGIGSAGGIISATTKRAVASRSFRKGTASTDSAGSYRGTLDFNQSTLNGKLGVRLNAVYGNGKTFRLFTFDRQKRAHLSATYHLTPQTRLRAEYEAGEIRANKAHPWNLFDAGLAWDAQGRPTFDTPVAIPAARVTLLPATRRVTYIGNSDRVIDMAGSGVTTSTSNMITNPRHTDYSINAGGPGALTDASFNTPSAYLEHQFGKKTFLEIAYNHQDSKFDALQPFGDSGALYAEPNRRLRNGETNPYAGRFYLEGTSVRWLQARASDNYRATLSTEFDHGKWGNYRLAALGEYERRRFRTGPVTEIWAGRPFNPAPENAANQVFRRNYVIERVWDTYHIPGPRETGLLESRVDPVSGRTLSSTWVAMNNNQNDDPDDQKSGLVSGQARYFGGRLVAGFGYRRDEVHILDRAGVRDPATQEWVVNYATANTFDFTGETRTLGLVGHVTRHVSLMYNRSSNIGLPSLNTRIMPNGTIASSSKGTGEDMGIALELFEGKLHARATYYKSGVIGASGGKGFGGTNSNPASFSVFILDALRNAGRITAAEQAAHTVLPAGGATWDNKTKGYEFSVTANPTKNWRWQANYSTTDLSDYNIAPEIGEWRASEIPYYRSFNAGNLSTANGSNTIDRVIQLFEDAWQQQKEIEGVGSVGARRHKVNVLSRYTFSSGALKGLYAGGGYRHQSKLLIGRDSAGNLQNSRSYWLADAFLGYRFHRTPILQRLSIQLNVFNIFDDVEPLIIRLSSDSSTVRRQIVQTPRLWRLTTDFEF